ncbi:Hypothetical protein TPAR_09728 [Tolypocladium paradoxum]|uniref:Uncharacterized protein n=1 Tax=Tolypocladium paradoxum TaxID=94208 RepID=A0A2S4KWG2_9HYPO|nr:Hypothetical protein TPAR_09728 [Tolypocladium paradoxum]
MADVRFRGLVEDSGQSSTGICRENLRGSQGRADMKVRLEGEDLAVRVNPSSPERGCRRRRMGEREERGGDAEEGGDKERMRNGANERN